MIVGEDPSAKHHLETLTLKSKALPPSTLELLDVKCLKKLRRCDALKSD